MIVRRVYTAGTSVVIGDIVGIVVIGVIGIVEPTTNGNRRGVTRGCARPRSRLWCWQG